MEREKSLRSVSEKGAPRRLTKKAAATTCAAILAGPVSSAGMVEAEDERYWALAEEGEALERSQARRPIEITPLGESASSSRGSSDTHARRRPGVLASWPRGRDASSTSFGPLRFCETRGVRRH